MWRAGREFDDTDDLTDTTAVVIASHGGPEAETIDWVAALVALGVADLVDTDAERALATLGALRRRQMTAP